MPDLSMRETVAEALTEHGGWYTDPDEGAFCDCDHFLVPMGEYAVKAWEAHRADAVIAAMATLTDAGVEAGAKALCEDDRAHTELTGIDWPGWAEMGDFGRSPHRRRARTTITAYFNAGKEGRA